MNIPKLAKKVLNKTLDRWFQSTEEAARISNEDFRIVHQQEKVSIPLDKFTRLTGLYLKKKDFIAGQFTQVWSVNGFHVTAEGADWAKRSFLEENRDLFLVAIGAVFALVSTVLINLTMPNEIKVADETLNEIKDLIRARNSELPDVLPRAVENMCSDANRK